MYVVTFYSYKGGVGRTMALVNTAALLAKAGKRVLVVDFDLEAPGLPSYDMFSCAHARAGIVDYITTYRQTFVAPVAADYIVECERDGIKLWLMPAGDHGEPSYTARLNSVDWEKLYDSESGYLMFEDLKQQWDGYEGVGFDYVLIDSRTGHTDVGGICTRQLPDAVVVVFLPNGQNIEGLRPIVNGIREESEARPTRIALHFCPANVPEEYDEDEILAGLLDRASRELGYSSTVGSDQPAAVIHHRTSMELLSQPLVVLSRPKSKLATEYGSLKTSVIARNYADRDGALVALLRAPKAFEAALEAGRNSDFKNLAASANQIRREHPKDGEIAYRAARVLNMTSDFEDEIAALDTAIEAGYRVVNAKMAKAIALSTLNRKGEALGILSDVLTSPDATYFEIRPAAQLLRFIDEDWIETAGSLYRAPDTTVTAKTTLAYYMMTRREALPAIAAEMSALAGDGDLKSGQRDAARNLVVLCHIGSGHFEDGMHAITADRASLFNEESPVDLFNYAMAQWGQEGRPPLDLLERLLELKPHGLEMDANAHQCFAIVHAALGDYAAAAQQLDAAENEVTSGTVAFSCWRFLYATAEELSKDIDEMRDALRLGGLVPPFLEAVRGSLH